MVDTNSPQYLYQKRNVYYFSRHVPKDIREHYNTKRIVFSLKTKSEIIAIKSARSISHRLEDYWMSLRLSKLDIPASHLIRLQPSSYVASNAPLLSEALETYLRLKGVNKDKTFHRGARRNIEAVINALGDRPVDEYFSSDAALFRDQSFERGLNTASVKRNFSTIRAVINLTITEQGIECNNAFARTFMPDRDDVTKRKSVPLTSIRMLQKLCKRLDDDQRWLLALISDTGMRLSEALGLHIEDLKLDNKIPYIDLKPHPWRPLKTSSSERKIPLVGSALWAAVRIKSNSDGSLFAFPRYTSSKKCNANSASAALNKWMKPRLPEGCVIHSFRHSLRDRLRSVKCPSDIIDEIGGWVTAGVGHNYGEGYPLEIKAEMMKSIIMKVLESFSAAPFGNFH